MFREFRFAANRERSGQDAGAVTNRRYERRDEWDLPRRITLGVELSRRSAAKNPTEAQEQPLHQLQRRPSNIGSGCARENVDNPSSSNSARAEFRPRRDM